MDNSAGLSPTKGTNMGSLNPKNLHLCQARKASFSLLYNVLLFVTVYAYYCWCPSLLNSLNHKPIVQERNDQSKQQEWHPHSSLRKH